MYYILYCLLYYISESKSSISAYRSITIPPLPDRLWIEARVPVAVGLTALWMLLPPFIYLPLDRWPPTIGALSIHYLKLAIHIHVLDM